MENKKDSNEHSGKQPENTVMHSDYTSENESKEEDLPGYPHYPASEDLLNSANNEGRIDVNVENLTRSSRTSNLDLSETPPLAADSDVELPDSPALKDDEDDLGIVPGTEADVTREDLILLGARNQDMDMGEDEDIRNCAGFPLDTTGDDLDVPGSEDDDANESIGEEDEENNYYSLGGDEMDNIETGQQPE
jgi:hypothetical protein